MDQDVKLGEVGDIKIELAGGKAVISIEVKKGLLEGGIALQAGASAIIESSALVDLLFAAIEAKSPAGIVPIEETVKAIVKNAVMAIQ